MKDTKAKNNSQSVNLQEIENFEQVGFCLLKCIFYFLVFL